MYKLDKKLFRRYTHNAMERELTECVFVDDGVLLKSTRAGAEKAMMEVQSTSSDFGLSVSVQDEAFCNRMGGLYRIMIEYKSQ